MTASIVQGTTSLSYAYDATHNRVKQVETAGSTTTTTIYVDDLISGISAEKIGTSSTSYKWNDYIVIPAGMAFDGKASGIRVGMRTATVSGSSSSSADSYFVLDHLGSTAVIMDATGAVSQRLAYDPWGKRRNADGTDDTAGTIRSATNRGFTSHEHIDDVGLINMNARIYDPQIGRFMSADPLNWLSWQSGSDADKEKFVEYIVNPQNLNLYAYVNNGPLSKTDPTGEFVWLVPMAVGAGTGAAVDTVIQLVENGGDFKKIDGGRVMEAAAWGGGAVAVGPNWWLARTWRPESLTVWIQQNCWLDKWTQGISVWMGAGDYL